MPPPLRETWARRYGYGREYRAIAALAYSTELPKGIVVHHYCKDRSCSEPEHLDILTPEEHILK